MVVKLEALLEHLGIDWVVLYKPLGLNTIRNEIEWANLYNKDAELVRPLSMRLEGLGANSVRPCFLLPPLSRDSERVHTAFIYLEWSNRESRVFHLEFPFGRGRDFLWSWPTRHWPGTCRRCMRDHMAS